MDKNTVKLDGYTEETTVVDSSDDEYFDSTDSTVPKMNNSLAVTNVSPSISVSTIEGDPPEIEEDKDFNEIDNVQGMILSNKTIVLQLLSQIRIGMDLTRLGLPVFIFEKRSLLEMYSEMFAHPDILARSAELENPKDRMVELVRWFLSSLSSSRKVGVPKKPYNPVLGEVFRCYWDIPNGKRTPPNSNEKKLLETSPLCESGYDSLIFIAEQVSHHPPITAIYMECPSKRVFFSASIETKIKFLGLSVKIQNTGTFRMRFLNQNEEYVGTIPTGYARSLLTNPWFEFGGECKISCAKTGYTANIEFHTKPFRGGQRHRITGDIKHASESKALMKFEGHWNSIIFKRISKNSTEVFFDVKDIPTIRKKIKKFSFQKDYESRVVWRHLTESLEREDTEAASDAKHEVEESQRVKARELKLKGEEWNPRFFTIDTGKEETFWEYKATLEKRIKDL